MKIICKVNPFAKGLPVCIVKFVAMTRVGLLSDTHGYLDDAIKKHLESVDQIWHAGDFGTIAVLEELEAMKPVKAVYGNIDGAELRLCMPECRAGKVEDISVLMLHIGGYPGRYSPKAKALIKAHMPDLFISGHSHILKIMRDPKTGMLHINPGAAGRHGFHHVRTMVRFSIEGRKIKDVEVIELGPRSEQFMEPGLPV